MADKKSILHKDIIKVKGTPIKPDSKKVIKSVTDKITTKDVAKLTPMPEFQANKKMLKNFQAQKTIEKKADDLFKTASTALKTGNKKLAKSAASGLKQAGRSDLLQKLIQQAAKHKSVKSIIGAVPIVGNLASALISQDASAAIPDEIAPVETGPEKGSIDYKLESGMELTDEEKQQLFKNRFTQD